MKPLPKYREILMWFCIYPAHENVTNHQKMLHIAFIVFINGTFLCFIASSITYFLENISTDVEKSLFALLEVAGIAGGLHKFSVAFILRKKITAMFERLSEICDASKYFLKSEKKTLAKSMQLFFFKNLDKNSNSNRFLTEANRTCEWMWHIYFKCILVGIFLVIAMSCVLEVLICYMMYGSSDISKHLYHPLHIR